MFVRPPTNPFADGGNLDYTNQTLTNGTGDSMGRCSIIFQIRGNGSQTAECLQVNNGHDNIAHYF